MKHGYADHPLYKTHWDIVSRCENPRSAKWQYYGARGIRVYEDWRHDVGAFIAYVESKLGVRPAGYSLDRIDVNGDYVPGNLRWASSTMQNINKRSRAGSSSQYLNVARTKYGTWQAQLRRNGKRYSMGTFPTEKEAHHAVKEWKRLHDTDLT